MILVGKCWEYIRRANLVANRLLAVALLLKAQRVCSTYYMSHQLIILLPAGLTIAARERLNIYDCVAPLEIKNK